MGQDRAGATPPPSTTTAHPHDHHDQHDHDDEHEHPHGPQGDQPGAHDHAHGDDDHDEHDHAHGGGALGWLRELLPFGHGHSHGEVSIDSALEGSDRGIWALKVSLFGLGVTAAFQLVIVAISGSVGLLADTIHNFSDALTAVPLWIAFALGKRAANRRYTYGYGRAEDVAGVVVVGFILASAIVAAYESIRKLIDPQPVTNIGWVIAAAIVGFIGNEAVAVFRIRVGRQIGSAALVADGMHARADGFTSLAVLFGALGVVAGFPLADPLIGLLITLAILVIVKDTARTMWRRLMDAVDPELVETIERTAVAVPGVEEVHEPRLRWLGHRLRAELHITVDGDLSTRESHAIGEEVRHALFHALPRLDTIDIHIDPGGPGAADSHAATAHHTTPHATG